MILYSTGCPQCKVLEAKLQSKNIKVDMCSDLDAMQAKGFLAAPMLELDDGTALNFSQAINWLKERD